MLTLASNSLRTVLNPSDDFTRRAHRQPNLSTGATVALVVGGIIVVPIVIWGIIAAMAVKSVSNAQNDFGGGRLPPGAVPPGTLDPNDYPSWPNDFPS